MPNPLQAAIAFIRQRPALALAAGGVGVVAIAASVGRRLDADAPPPVAAVDTSTASPIAGYGAGLTGGFLGGGGDPFASAERSEQTASIVNAINAAAAAQAARDAARVVPLPTPPPTQPTPQPVQTPTPPATAPARLTLAQARSILTALGAPASWADRAASLFPYAMANATELRAWALRAAAQPTSGYRVVNGKIVKQ